MQLYVSHGILVGRALRTRQSSSYRLRPGQFKPSSAPRGTGLCGASQCKKTQSYAQSYSHCIFGLLQIFVSRKWTYSAHVHAVVHDFLECMLLYESNAIQQHRDVYVSHRTVCAPPHLRGKRSWQHCWSGRNHGHLPPWKWFGTAFGNRRQRRRSIYQAYSCRLIGR